MKPTLSLVFGTRNRANDLRRLLDSIEDTIPESLKYEVVISDASDQPIEQEEIATDGMWQRIHVIREYPPIGCTKGYNVAFRKAKGTYCLWLNDDCALEPGCAENAVEFMRTHPDIGIGAISYAEPNKRAHINSYMGMIYANFGIVNRILGNRVGWFDEDFEMYGNDNSLCFRILMDGKGIAVVPNAKIFHFATYDHHRIVNNDPAKRRHTVERLVAKYGPELPKMRATYDRFIGPVEGVRDQTPAWVRQQSSIR